MDFLTSDTFITVISVVVSVAGLLLALRADIGKRIDRVERRLGQRIDRVEDGLGKRIDRVEGRARADHQKLVAEVGELKAEVGEAKTAVGEAKTAVSEVKTAVGEMKTAVSEVKTAVTAVSTKLDERSSLRPLMVQESQQDYAVQDQPDGSSEAPEDGPTDTTGGGGEARQTSAE